MRVLSCMDVKLHCKVCQCGNHRGCQRQTPPGKTSSGAIIPYTYVQGAAVAGCPCIKADDERIKKAANKIKAAAKEERSVKSRLTAIEKVLWGRSFQGVVALTRPNLLISSDDLMSEKGPKKKKRKT